MSDVVERLQLVARYAANAEPATKALLNDAVAEIERLRAIAGDLLQADHKAEGELLRARAEIERLRAALRDGWASSPRRP